MVHKFNLRKIWYFILYYEWKRIVNDKLLFLEALACITFNLQKIWMSIEQLPTCIIHTYFHWSVLFHSRFLFACLKNGFPGVLDLKHREIPTGWRQTVGNPFFLNHNHGADLAFSPRQTKVHKRPIVSSLTHHALAVLFAMKTVTSQHLSWCLWYCVVQCVLLASSSSLEPWVETWCCPSQNSLRQNERFRPFR